jgi:hypothetical protein
MKIFQTRGLICALILVISAAGFAPAQEGMGFNGVAGLYVVPTGSIGWERETNLGIDMGVSYNFQKKNPMAKIGFSIFKWLEVTGAFDFQPDVSAYGNEETGNNFDYIMGLKIQLPTTNTAIALGGNLQLLHPSYGPWDSGGEVDIRKAGQLYASATYSGSLFGMPTDTTIALGYTFVEGSSHSDIDFGMGFDMVLFPDVFQKYLHALIDFSNFSYSVDPLGIDTAYRGSLNTGFRIDIGAAPALKKIKLMVDIIATDILDDGNRSFVLGLVFGGAVL